MKRKAHSSRWGIALLATVTLASFAGTASADHGGSRRFKGVGGGFGRERVIVRDHSSGAGPALAGLIGGFILGSAVSSHSQPVVVRDRRDCERGYGSYGSSYGSYGSGYGSYDSGYRSYEPEYRYYDPYDDVWFDSLDQCDNGGFAPRLIEVIDVRSGRVVQRLRHHDGAWIRVSAGLR